MFCLWIILTCDCVISSICQNDFWVVFSIHQSYSAFISFSSQTCSLGVFAWSFIRRVAISLLNLIAQSISECDFYLLDKFSLCHEYIDNLKQRVWVSVFFCGSTVKVSARDKDIVTTFDLILLSTYMSCVRGKIKELSQHEVHILLLVLCCVLKGQSVITKFVEVL